jgi:hypothetical protein
VPLFDAHIHQAKCNLAFLEKINAPEYFDWQVTVCFYTAVHLINAHLSLHNLQYRKHVDVKNAINPFSRDAISSGSALPEDVFISYKTLELLSRRSRYLVNIKDDNLYDHTSAALTFEIHLLKTLRHLDKIIRYMIAKDYFSCPEIALKCEGIRQGELIFAR